MDHAMARDMVAFLSRALPYLTPLLPEGEKWREGGWVHITDPEGVPLIHERVGHPSPEREARYIELSAEKAGRLRANPTHHTSRESADEALNRYPGAIRLLNGAILSFSGYPAALDEALMFYLGIHFRLMAIGDAETWGCPDSLGYLDQLLALQRD